MPLYKITAKGGSHARRETVEGKSQLVVYRHDSQRREGERSEIELTQDQYESGKYRHLGLVEVTRHNVRTDREIRTSTENDGLDAMKVADLRALAELHNVELEPSDNRKDEIIVKLRAAGVKAE